jgi:hypothetical protein
MSEYYPENPLGANDQRSDGEQFTGYVIVTATTAFAAFACATISQKTGAELIGYPAVAVTEGVALMNAWKAADLAQTICERTVSKFFNS